MLRISRPLAFALMLSLALAATALAGLPSTKHKLIAPGKSLGGVKLGGTFAAAKAAWGSGGHCSTMAGFHYCSYSTGDNADGSATFSAPAKGKITAIQAITGYGSDGEPNFKTSLTKFKTKKGIRLGSTEKAVTKAYPKAKKHAIQGASNHEWWVTGPKKHVTRFQMSSAPERVIGVVMQSSG
jgi:hypothetical protein